MWYSHTHLHKPVTCRYRRIPLDTHTWSCRPCWCTLHSHRPLGSPGIHQYLETEKPLVSNSVVHDPVKAEDRIGKTDPRVFMWIPYLWGLDFVAKHLICKVGTTFEWATTEQHVRQMRRDWLKTVFPKVRGLGLSASSPGRLLYCLSEFDRPCQLDRHEKYGATLTSF